MDDVVYEEVTESEGVIQAQLLNCEGGYVGVSAKKYVNIGDVITRLVNCCLNIADESDTSTVGSPLRHVSCKVAVALCVIADAVRTRSSGAMSPPSMKTRRLSGVVSHHCLLMTVRCSWTIVLIATTAHQTEWCPATQERVAVQAVGYVVCAHCKYE